MYPFKRKMKNLFLFFTKLNFKSVWTLIKHPSIVSLWISRINPTFFMENGKLMARLEDYNVVVQIKDLSNIFILHEIFYETIYRINTPEQCVVIDIGMNIGVASLYFATQENVEKVYSFEPFRETSEQALFNFSINKKFNKKISAFTYGISDKNETIAAFYYPESNGTSTTAPEDASKENSYSQLKRKEDVKLRSASEVVDEIAATHGKDKKIILKIDCEGAEYKIFESLEKNNSLRKIDYILMEWHARGEYPLLEILNRNGYVSFLRRINPDIGNMYCAKVK